MQPAPPLPPENIVNDHDRQLQINYEQWLKNHDNTLAGKLKYYQEEVTKLRKARKSLNTKQRGLKKSGNDLTHSESIELTQVTNDQTIMQKQLENARKQTRQHATLKQEYRNKQAAKMQPQMMSHQGSSPAQMAPQSPLMSPSPSNSSQHSMMQSAQSPLGNPMMQPSCSPLQSPSPLMSHSPGPGSNAAILQSPNNQAGLSPYSTMQPSPRIGTPHSQDESPFSPGAIGYVHSFIIFDQFFE